MRAELWEARERRIRAIAEECSTIEDLASKAGVCVSSAHTYAKRFSLKLAHASSVGVKHAHVIDDLKAFAEAGKTRQEAAAHFDLSLSTIGRISQAHNIDFVHGTYTPDNVSRAEAMASMYASGKTLREIGELFGVTRERVRQVVSKRAKLTAADGGQSVRAKMRAEAKAARRDATCLKKYGCSYTQYRELVAIGTDLVSSGGSRNASPTGAWHSQRRNAIERGIEWRLTLWQWWSIWQKSGKWAERGRGKGRYVMCRFGDTGAYEPGNVYIATCQHNASVQPNNPYRKGHPDHERVIAEIRHKLTGGRRRSRSGDLPIGITRHKNRFMAQIGVNGRSKYIGRFDTVEEAHQAYLAAAAALGRKIAA